MDLAIQTVQAVEQIEFDGRSIRAVDTGGRDRSGDRVIVFVAKDLVEAVGATWAGHSLDHIPGQYRGMVSVSTPSGDQQMVSLTEPGMNMYLFRSDKPAALPWQKHLAEVILPTIRRTGQYVAKPMTQIEVIAASANALVEVERKLADLAEKAEQTHAMVIDLERHRRAREAEVATLTELPPASLEVMPETDGQRTYSALQRWGRDHDNSYSEATSRLYASVVRRLRLDLKARLRNAKSEWKATFPRVGLEPRLSDVIDASGSAAAIYAIALNIFPVPQRAQQG